MTAGFFGHYFQNEVTDQDESEMIRNSPVSGGIFMPKWKEVCI